jgi:hypothetical protein
MSDAKPSKRVQADADRAARKAARRLAQLDLRNKEQRAWELHIAGATYDQIARECGYKHPATARAAVMRVLDRQTGPSKISVEQARARTIARLDRMLLAVWGDVLIQPKVVVNPDGSRTTIDVDWERRNQAIELALRIEDRRAKLEGLDKPLQIDLDAAARQAAKEWGLDPDELIAETRQLRLAFKAGNRVA